MRALRRAFARLFGIFNRRADERRLSEEFEQHLEEPDHQRRRDPFAGAGDGIVHLGVSADRRAALAAVAGNAPGRAVRALPRGHWV